MVVKNETENFTQILMLDKEDKLMNAVKNYFSFKKIQIITTNKLDKAWLELEKNLPDCLVIDIAMPNNEGFNFIKNLKKNKNFQHIPFILLTAKGLTEDRVLGYRLGCSAYISKPFDPEELESIIENVVVRNNSFIESVMETYILLKVIKLTLKKKYIQSIKTELQFSLTSQENFILNQVLLGIKISTISLNLNISRRNTERYVTRLLDKTHSKNLGDLKSLFWFIKYD